MSKRPPLHAFAGEQQHQAEAESWARFAAGDDAAPFHRDWLAMLCAQVEQGQGALLMLNQGPGTVYELAATWPAAAQDMRHLGATAQRTLTERRSVVLAPDGHGTPATDQAAQLGLPVEADGHLRGAVVLELAAHPKRDLAQSLQRIHWGLGWLVAELSRQDLAGRDARLAQMASVQGLAAVVLEEGNFLPSALALVNHAAAQLGCSRVSLGVDRGGHAEVKALSHTASFDRKADLVRRLAGVMDEALDLGAMVVVPAVGAGDAGAPAHAEAARAFDDVALCSVLLDDGGQPFGVLTLERGEGAPFTPAELDLLQAVGLMLGPVLALKQRNDRGALARARDQGREAWVALVGPQHPGLKLIGALAALLVVFFAVFTTDHRVAAPAVVEGEVQRAAVAPFDGFIAESRVRAGDTVTQGQLMARLDERDLRLEQARWLSEREQAERKHRVALAGQDRGAMAVLAAQVNQADAQLQLVQERLARTQIVAPFDGLVVSGDLSQLLGTPVEQGKVLFEVAPRDRFRVILKVDERDIASLQVGQAGELLLSGLPGEAMHFSVKQLTPVSTPQDGRNHFRVEAELQQPPERLRPGMEGVGKVLVGRARLIWIWTHGFTDWLRLAVWNWLP